MNGLHAGADHVSDSELQRIADETIMHRKLVHPNIIAFHEFFASQTAMVTIMEYAQGMVEMTDSFGSCHILVA